MTLQAQNQVSHEKVALQQQIKAKRAVVQNT